MFSLLGTYEYVPLCYSLWFEVERDSFLISHSIFDSLFKVTLIYLKQGLLQPLSSTTVWNKMFKFFTPSFWANLRFIGCSQKIGKWAGLLCAWDHVMNQDTLLIPEVIMWSQLLKRVSCNKSTHQLNNLQHLQNIFKKKIAQIIKIPVYNTKF